jgi:hypothetical protein
LRLGAGDDLPRVKGILNLIGESAAVAIRASTTFFIPLCCSTLGPIPIIDRESC